MGSNAADIGRSETFFLLRGLTYPTMFGEQPPSEVPVAQNEGKCKSSQKSDLL
jgi:hypothetical protein